jgi:hypothetical protein
MYPLDIAKVTAALGGVSALGCDPHSVAELSDAIADGLVMAPDPLVWDPRLFGVPRP